MRTINYIVVHCSATREDCVLTPENLEAEHRRRGFNGIGYHYYIRKDGTVVDTRTPEQRSALRLLVFQLLKQFPSTRLCGHRDLSPDLDGDGVMKPEEWVKQCPCFEVAKEL